MATNNINRINSRNQNNQPPEAKKIGRLHEQMAKMREQLEEIIANRTNPLNGLLNRK